MRESGNLYRKTSPRPDVETIDSILKSRNFRVERIVSLGHASPEGFWYQQVDAEWVAVLEGRARLRFQDGTVLELNRGDYVLIPAGERHRVDWTDPNSPTIWLAIHFNE